MILISTQPLCPRARHRHCTQTIFRVFFAGLVFRHGTERRHQATFQHIRVETRSSKVSGQTGEARDKSRTTRKRNTPGPLEAKSGAGTRGLMDKSVSAREDLPSEKLLRAKLLKDCPSGRIAATVFDYSHDDLKELTPELEIAWSMFLTTAMHRNFVTALDWLANGPDFLYVHIPTTNGCTSHPSCCTTLCSLPCTATCVSATSSNTFVIIAFWQNTLCWNLVISNQNILLGVHGWLVCVIAERTQSRRRNAAEEDFHHYHSRKNTMTQEKLEMVWDLLSWSCNALAEEVEP